MLASFIDAVKEAHEITFLAGDDEIGGIIAEREVIGLPTMFNAAWNPGPDDPDQDLAIA